MLGPGPIGHMYPRLKLHVVVVITSVYHDQAVSSKQFCCVACTHAPGHHGAFFD